MIFLCQIKAPFRLTVAIEAGGRRPGLAGAYADGRCPKTRKAEAEAEGDGQLPAPIRVAAAPE